MKGYSMKELRAMARERGVKMPHGCNKKQLTQLLQDGTGFEAKAEPLPVVEPKAEPVQESRANWGAAEINNRGERKGVHCGAGSTDITRVMRAGRLVTRYRQCVACNKRFTTREILE